MAQDELKTAPFDPRFPNTNQTLYCYVSYLDYHRCSRLFGYGYEPCNYFKQVYTSMCPNSWVTRWDSQRENGTFPGKIDRILIKDPSVEPSSASKQKKDLKTDQKKSCTCEE